MAKVTRELMIENATIFARNFKGEEGPMNPPGRRYFCVFLEEHQAQQLKADGWNVKWLKPRNPDDEPKPYMQVRVNFGDFPPRIVAVSSKNKVELTADGVNVLDWAEIEYSDIVIRPYNWDVNGKQGVTAYVKTMYVNLKADPLADKYKDVPDSASSAFLDEDVS